MSKYTNKTSVIYGVEGLKVTDNEKSFFRDLNPLGYIIFSRNIESKDQVRKLCDEFRNISGIEDTPIMIDQEGGRVARLRPPLFKEHKAAEFFGKLALTNIDSAKKAAFLNHLLIGQQLKEYGINFDCAPVCDLRYDYAHEIIGTRSFGSDPLIVSELANSAADGLRAANVVPIIKHIPGHGRALLDSHEDLPVVDASLAELESTDFKVFKNTKHHDWAMTAHIIFDALDISEPVTHSCKAINYIRETIGFKNILISDDLSMKALKGTYAERAKKSYIAGCNVLLHCNGKMDEMIEIGKEVRKIDDALSAAIEKSFNCSQQNPSLIHQDFLRLDQDEIFEMIEKCAA